MYTSRRRKRKSRSLRQLQLKRFRLALRKSRPRSASNLSLRWRNSQRKRLPRSRTCPTGFKPTGRCETMSRTARKNWNLYSKRKVRVKWERRRLTFMTRGTGSLTYSISWKLNVSTKRISKIVLKLSRPSRPSSPTREVGSAKLKSSKSSWTR